MKKLITTVMMLTVFGIAVLAFFKFTPTLPSSEKEDENTPVDTPSDVTYSISSEHLSAGHVFAHGGMPDLTHLTIQKNEGGVVTEIPIDESMISFDSSNAGAQEVVIRYGEEEFRLSVTVKYLIEFRSMGEVIGVQYALTPSDIAPPIVEVPTDMRFVGWSEKIPSALSGNMVFDAVFEYDTPHLQALTAEYGDTLASLTLPENKLGSWRFTDTPDTDVGAVGDTRDFAVEFISPSGEVLDTDSVSVTVKKRQLSFKNIVTNFVYNGEKQIPTYTLDADATVIFLESPDYNYTDAATYAYEFVIVDDNYEGECRGTYTIEKASVTVTPKTYSISAVDPLPDFAYTVEGFDEEKLDLLGIEITHPTISGIGEYPLGAAVTNPNVSLTVKEGRLTVRPAYPEIDRVGAPVLNTCVATYEDMLSSLTFEWNANGKWAWKSANDEVGPAGTRTHTAVFTHNDSRYEPIEYDIDIQVNKKQLYFKVDKATLLVTYDTAFHGVVYTIEDINGKEYSSLSVLGDERYDRVGDYPIYLSLNEQNYTATYSATLSIDPATPITSFGALEGTFYWSASLKLGDIPLPDGYAWCDPSTRLTDIENYSYRAIFTPTDTHNYKTVEDSFTFAISRAPSSVLGVESSYSIEFDDGVFTLSGVKASHGEVVDIVIRYLQNGEDADIRFVGDYSIVITISQSAHYQETSATIPVNVFPRENRDTIPTYEPEYGDTAADLALPSTTTGTWEWKEKDAVMSELGERTLTLVFTPMNANYAPCEIPVTFTVERQTVPEPEIPDKDYNGQRQYSELERLDENYSLYKIIEDEGGITFGSYSVTLELHNPELYRWASDETKATTNVSFNIVNVANKWQTAPVASRTNWQYDGLGVTFTAKALYGGDVTPYFTDSEGNVLTDEEGNPLTSCPTDAGSYTAVFSVASTASYSGLYKEIPITIDHIPVPPPKAPPATTPYSGSNIDSGIAPTEAYGVDDEGSISPKKCKVTITLDKNHKWNEGAPHRVIEYEYEIVRAESGIKITEAPSWNYLDSPIDPTWTADFTLTGEVTYLYSETIDGTYSSVPTFANDYYVKAVYAGDTNILPGKSTPVPFSILKGTPTLSGYSATISGTHYMNLFAMPSTSGHTATYKTNTVTGAFTYSALTFAEGENKSHITLTFTPADTNNYRSVSVKVYLTLYTVAKIGTTPYGSIESALDAASKAGGGTVWVLPDNTGKLYIMSDVKIDTDVTLILPYGENEGDYNQKNKDGNYEATTNGKHTMAKETACTLFVTLADGVTLTNKGTLLIAGILTGGNAGSATARYDSGATQGAHARLVLGKDSKIVSENGSRIDCLGFIVEKNENNGSTVIIDSGATLLEPFVVHDFRGGSFMYAVYQGASYKYCPFSEYSIQNVTPMLRINYGGTLQAVANLYAGKQQNATTINMIGLKNNSTFIQLTTQESYVEAKCTFKSNKLDKIKLDVYGGATTGGMQLSIKMIFTISVDTKNYYFPIPYFYDVTLNKAEKQESASYDMPQSYAIRGGASFTVGEGVTLTMGELVIYDESKIPDLTYGGTAYPNDDKGRFTINGTLIVDRVGGEICTELDNGAIVIIRSAASLTTNDAYGSAITGDNFSARIDPEKMQATTHLTQLIPASDGSQTVEVATYRFIDGEWRCIRIKFNTDGGSTHTPVSTETLKYPALPTPTKAGYAFEGWEYNGTLVKEGDALLFIGEHTLTAKWRKLLWITLDTNGGEPLSPLYIDTTTDALVYTLPTPVRAGANFLGWFYEGTEVKSGDALRSTTAHTLTAEWKMLIPVHLDANGGTLTKPTVYFDPSEAIYPTLTPPTKEGHTFLGWYYGETKVESGGNIPNGVTGEHTLTAHWQVNSYTVTVNTSDATVSGVTSGQTVEFGTTVSFTVSYDKTSTSLTIKDANKKNVEYDTDTSNGEKVITFTMPASNVTIEASSKEESSSGGCVTPDTLITLADGTQVRVDSLTGKEYLLVWNMETGMLDSAPMMFVDSDAEAECEVIYLYFSDGTVVKVIYEHGFWDYDLNRYVYLDKNAADYIGHTFAKQNENALERVELIDVVIETQLSEAWSPVTAGHLCYFVNGMLSMPGGVAGLFNIFEVDPETMTYDYEQLEEDILAYGLYTYEELNALCPLSEEMFNQAGGAYLKISIAKGNLTEEELIKMIKRYSKFFE